MQKRTKIALIAYISLISTITSGMLKQQFCKHAKKFTPLQKTYHKHTDDTLIQIMMHQQNINKKLDIIIKNQISNLQKQKNNVDTDNHHDKSKYQLELDDYHNHNSHNQDLWDCQRD